METTLSVPKVTHIGSLFTTEQRSFLDTPTPKAFISTRKGKGGIFRYVKSHHVLDALDHLFGCNWSFVIVSTERVGDFIFCHGRLTVFAFVNGEKHEVVREQFGSAEVKYLNDEKGKKTDQPLDLGNDYKAAATDARKKCAMELGLFRDVYMKEEDAEIRYARKQKVKEREAEAIKSNIQV